MIWLVQTIFSNYRADSIPRSLYFFSPFLAGRPLVDLTLIDETSCAEGY
jgi:hypothetical protein